MERAVKKPWRVEWSTFPRGDEFLKDFHDEQTARKLYERLTRKQHVVKFRIYNRLEDIANRLSNLVDQRLSTQKGLKKAWWKMSHKARFSFGVNLRKSIMELLGVL